MRKYLLVGRTGMGKSSFINTAFGQYIADTSEYEACTKIVEHYAYNSPLGNISLIDTPGLGESDSFTDDLYLSMIRSKVNLNEIYSLLYVTRLDDTRLRADERKTLKSITDKLGVNIWNNAVLILTFAASIPAEKRSEIIAHRIDMLEEFLCSCITTIHFSKYCRNPKFDGFRNYWVVDNVVSNWTNDGVPAISLLMS